MKWAHDNICSEIMKLYSKDRGAARGPDGIEQK